MNPRLKLMILGLLLLFTAVLSGCSSENLDRLWLKSDGWSRGLLLGETAMASPVPLALDRQGDAYAVVFPRSQQDQEMYQPILVGLSPDGQTRTTTLLDLLIPQPRKAKLFLSDGNLDLFWIGSNQLQHLRLDKRGNLLSEVSILSTEDRVDHLEVIQYQDAYQIWYSGSQDSPGIYALTGTLDNLQKTEVDPAGMRVDLVLDADDQLHTSWIRYPLNYGEVEYFYLIHDPAEPPKTAQEPLFSRGISPAVRLDGPILAVDDEVSYLIWSEAVVSGLDAGTRLSYYRYFPNYRPDTIRPTMQLRVPIAANLPTDEFSRGTFDSGERVFVYGGIPSSSALENMEILSGQYQETPLVFRSRSEFKWRDFRNQANIAYLSDGLVTSYQPLSYTSAESYYPGVAADQNRNLYVTWLEKGERTFRAYLTTTDPVKQSSIDRVTFQDYLYLGAEGLFGMLAGAVLSPFAAAAWGGVGLLAFLINLIFSQFNRPIFRTIGEILSILGGIGIFWWMKWVTLPGLRDGYVPLSAWIPRIPNFMEDPLVYGIPALIGLIGLGVAYFNTYGKKSGSAINFHLLYCAVDTLLSCAVYGILIYGSF